MKLIKHEIPEGTKVFRPTAPFKGRVVSNDLITSAKSVDDIRHIVIDLSGSGISYIEGQSVGVIAPGVDESGKPHKLRLYSISSSRRGDDGLNSTVSLTVKRVIWNDEGGNSKKGICSNYLCDIKPKDEIFVTGPVGRHFALPFDDSVNLIMVAAGTGIAPFRAFIHHIYREKGGWKGKVRLFFGAKTKGELLYMNEGNSDIGLFMGETTFKAWNALSREENLKKVYVQDKILEQKEEIWPLILEGNFAIYICGLKGMEEGIEKIFDQWAAESGKSWATMREEFKAEGRYNIEVY